MDLSPFRHWLNAHHYSPSTIRNYLADTNRYLASIGTQDPFSQKAISSYFDQISNDVNAKRYLASLNTFCQFGLDQNIIARNPLKNVKKSYQRQPVTSFDELLQQYQTYLQKRKVAPSTIKNYLVDIRQFVEWTSS